MTDIVIGVPLDPMPLILTTRRDFRWSFEHKDKDGKSVVFPAGKLFFELQTGGAGSASQSVTVERATGGNFAVSLNGVKSAPIVFDAKAAVVQAAVEKLSGVGAGNVKVSADVTPVWLYTGSITGGTPAGAAVEAAVATLFSSLSGLSGVDVKFTFNNPGYEIVVTSRKVFDEVSFTGWSFDALKTAGSMIQAEIVKLIPASTVSCTVAYCPKRVFHFAFQGSLANTPVGSLSIDSTALVGQKQTVSPLVVSPGVSAVTVWEFTIAGTKAEIKVESEQVDKVPNRTKWQLVWMPSGEPAGGDPVALGSVRRQG